MSSTTLNTLCASSYNLPDTVLNPDTGDTPNTRDSQNPVDKQNVRDIRNTDETPVTQNRDTKESRDIEDERDTRDKQDTIRGFKVGSYQRNEFEPQQKETEGISSTGNVTTTNDESRHMTHSEHFT